jgi:formylglycine-generating enzyme required for sulfatase activity
MFFARIAFSLCLLRSDLLMGCIHWFHGRWIRLRVLSIAAGALATAASMAAPSYAGTVTFGSGSNAFNMEFVTIGNPNNLADTTGSPNPAGSVGYTYGIGKFEVSEDMITKYNADFGTANSLAITKDTRGTAKPATNVSWNEAARFVNWLNTSTGNQAAYKFTTSGVNDDIALWQSGDAGYDSSNPYRNSLAKYVLPSTNEWYKAAYYDPNKSGGAGYWDYATGSDSAPALVASGTGTGANGNNEAVYNEQSGPADVNLAGGLSPYGVMGFGGNAFEWEESSINLVNSSGSTSRGIRGGSWLNDSYYLRSSVRLDQVPNHQDVAYAYIIGFRVASLSSDAVVPEPSMMVIGTLFGLGGLVAKRRLRK